MGRLKNGFFHGQDDPLLHLLRADCEIPFGVHDPDALKTHLFYGRTLNKVIVGIFINSNGKINAHDSGFVTPEDENFAYG